MIAARRARLVMRLVQMTPAFLAFGILRHVVPLRTLVQHASRPSTRLRNPADERLQADAAVKLGHIFTPFDRNCLQRSLLLYRTLGKAGARPQLVVGFRRDSRGLRGHAWVTVDGQPVVDTPSDVVGFVPTCTFAADGTMTPAT